ncbi:MAG: division/cell wall cluster transcriptional repressor MraZ [Deltaproteobacteria bacterium]|nr:MAG: division/cell wall cluster transcriptional repressor MraZ [Deltaproteobacteria bacterium]
MFRGRYEHTMDSKGRLSIPSKFREILMAHSDERLIVTNFDGCLWAYPFWEWKLVEEKVAALPQFKPEVKDLQRFFISAASECPLDPNGRVIIPPTLRKYADLNQDVIIVGMTKRIEIWAAEKWQKVFEKAESDLSHDGGAKLADLGL